jgi:hypothetical protein
LRDSNNLFGEESKPMPTTIELASAWLKGRTFASWRDEFDRRGYLIFERVLPPDRVAEIRTALAPFLAGAGHVMRNAIAPGFAALKAFTS